MWSQPIQRRVRRATVNMTPIWSSWLIRHMQTSARCSSSSSRLSIGSTSLRIWREFLWFPSVTLAALSISTSSMTAQLSMQLYVRSMAVQTQTGEHIKNAQVFGYHSNIIQHTIVSLTFYCMMSVAQFVFNNVLNMSSFKLLAVSKMYVSLVTSIWKGIPSFDNESIMVIRCWNYIHDKLQNRWPLLSLNESLVN